VSIYVVYLRLSRQNDCVGNDEGRSGEPDGHRIAEAANVVLN
jgi:hypothetical protein